MKADVQLTNGRIVTHRPYGNGATEALMQDGGEMSDAEWVEYVRLTTPAPKRKPTWQEIKSDSARVGIDHAIPGTDRSVRTPGF